jgi:hypothetical protein
MKIFLKLPIKAENTKGPRHKNIYDTHLKLNNTVLQEQRECEPWGDVAMKLAPARTSLLFYTKCRDVTVKK